MASVHGAWWWEQLLGGSRPGNAMGLCALALDRAGGSHVLASEAFPSRDYHYFRTHGAGVGRHRLFAQHARQSHGCVDLAIDSRGVAHALFASWGGDGAGGILADLHYVQHDGTAELRSETLAGLRAMLAGIALDGRDDPAVAYYAAAPDRTFYLALKQGHGPFQIQQVGPPNSWMGQWPSLRFDAKNRLHIAHYDNRGIRPWYSCWDANGTWTHEAIEPINAGGYYPALAIEPQSSQIMVAYAAFAGSSASPRPVRLATRTAQGQWGVEDAVPDGLFGAQPSLAVDSDGRPHVLAQTHPNGDLVLAVRDGGRWLREVVLPGAGRHSSVRIAVDALDVPRIAVVRRSVDPWDAHLLLGHRQARFSKPHITGGSEDDPTWLIPDSNGQFDF